VEQGRAVILTSFSPDTTGTDSLPTFESLLSSVRWGPPTASD
jgi:hypothetical protein